MGKQTKRVLRYLKIIEGLGMHFEKSIPISLVGFIDSNSGGSEEGMMSISRYRFSLRKKYVQLTFKEAIRGDTFFSREAKYIAAYLVA